MPAAALKALDATLRNIENVLDVDKLRRDKAELEEQASAPDLWDDQARAQEVNSRLSYLSGEIARLERLRGIPVLPGHGPALTDCGAAAQAGPHKTA